MTRGSDSRRLPVLAALVAALLPGRDLGAADRGEALALGAAETVGAAGIAGLRAARRGGGFWKPFLRGCIGGALMQGGRELYSRNDRTGAGVAGKLLHAAGGSLVRQSLEEAPARTGFDLPLGPLLLSTQCRHPRVRLLPGGAAGLAYAIGTGARLDLGESLRLLTPVFRDRHADRIARTVFNSVILPAPGLGSPARRARLLRHEGMHVLQYERGLGFAPLLRPLLPAALRDGPAGSRLELSADLVLPLWLPVREFEVARSSTGACDQDLSGPGCRGPVE